MIENVFVDTNVLVYERDFSEPQKQEKAAKWISHLWQSRRGRLSAQVLNEFYVTVTQKLQPGMNREMARKDIRDLLAWRPLPVNIPMIESAWHAQEQYGVSFWDALIVSAAQMAGCRYLLSEDFQAEQKFDQLEVINPFVSDPGS